MTFYTCVHHVVCPILNFLVCVRPGAHDIKKKLAGKKKLHKTCLFFFFLLWNMPQPPQHIAVGLWLSVCQTADDQPLCMWDENVQPFLFWSCEVQSTSSQSLLPKLWPPNVWLLSPFLPDKSRSTLHSQRRQVWGKGKCFFFLSFWLTGFLSAAPHHNKIKSKLQMEPTFKVRLQMEPTFKTRLQMEPTFKTRLQMEPSFKTNSFH